MLVWKAPGRLAAIYPRARHDDSKRRLPVRRPDEVTLDHRDVASQKQVLHEVYGGDGWQVLRLLSEVGTSADFYFDTISRIVVSRWTTRRVALVGDAGNSPGPAVGGGTSIAVVGAYVLAQELARAGRDHQAGMLSYQDRMRELTTKGPWYRSQDHGHPDPSEPSPGPVDAGAAPPRRARPTETATAPVPPSCKPPQPGPSTPSPPDQVVSSDTLGPDQARPGSPAAGQPPAITQRPERRGCGSQSPDHPAAITATARMTMRVMVRQDRTLASAALMALAWIGSDHLLAHS